ncbi:hypothetical protein SCUCBS95973_007642 [Sporothrix curviconia]|uniref:DUF6536 domain-containing protein n=1 Tax=Sporothrix curviconia TaxID=1260050 RepID=A0ABP0CFE3_9PEZI
MDVISPPRDHEGQAYKYAWDEQGEVTNIQRVDSKPRPTKTRQTRQTRQTVQWPFQSISIDDSSLPPIPEPPSTADPDDVILPYRPATWQPRKGALRGYGGMDGDDDDDSSTVAGGETEKGGIRRSLIPDYVINYLRGETPETLAQRKMIQQEQLRLQAEVETTENEARLRGGGSLTSQHDVQPMPSPGYRRSDEPILRLNYPEKRVSYGTKSGGQRRRRRGVVAHGWRAGVALHGFLALVIFVVGVVSLAVAVTLQKRNDGSSSVDKGMPMAVIFSSDGSSDATSCSAARSVAWVLRAVLALFTMALLAGAQYVFQVLSSPTRAELDAAHLSRQWLDIGVPSLRNVMFLLRNRKSAVDGDGGGARFRSVLALLVIVAAVASSVLYGALVNISLVAPLSTTSTAPEYNVLLVTPDFLEGAPFSNSSSNNAGGLDRVTILQLQQLAANSEQPTLTNLTAAACLQAQASSAASTALASELTLFQIDDDDSSNSNSRSGKFSAILVVLTDAAVTALQATNSSVVETAPAGSAIVAAASQNIDSANTGSSNSVFEITKDGSNNEQSTFVVNESDVAFCLFQETAADATTADSDDGTAASTCNVTLNTTLLSAVVGLNLVTVLCFGFVLLPRKANRHFRHAPLITLGDAVASFLRDPDLTTRGACLLSKRDVVQHGVWNSMVQAPRLPGYGTGGVRHSTQSDKSGQSAQLPENIMQPMFLSAVSASDNQMNDRNTNTDQGSSYFWFRSISLLRWLAGSVAWLVLAGLSLAALVDVVSSSNSLGAFGQISPLERAVYGSFAASSSPSSSFSASWISTAILASLPQLGVAVLYLLSDAHLSAYFLSHESSLYAAAHQHHRNEQLQQHCRRPLRVSSRPRGHQTTSLYLTLPQLWSWTLLTLFSGLVFVLGQSVVVQGIQAPADAAAHPQLVLLGFSGVGLVVLLALFVALAAVVLVLSARRTPPPNASLGSNPLTLPGGSCSAVISGRCHPMPEEMAAEMTGNSNGSTGGPLPLWLRPLAWGPVPSYHHPYQGYNRRRELMREGTLASGGVAVEDDGEEDNIGAIVGHCTYSSGPLDPLDIARSYA